ncbi:MAG: hypothetical protein PHS44_07850 [Candidatus Dojkabacteria bacterium]|nr:hypothetical protein [Candidatus Dojkabacteria bacterium]
MEQENLLTTSANLQASCLELHFPLGGLPLPLSKNPMYYDGNIFFARVIAEAITHAELSKRGLPLEKMILAVSTNGVNDWWMDEFGWTTDERDYQKIILIWDLINEWAYERLISLEEGVSLRVRDPELSLVISFYEHVAYSIPKALRMVVVQHLLAINLYQGLTLFQERGFRRYLGFRELSVNDINMLKRMQLEKGGMMALYAALLLPSYFDLNNCLPRSAPSLVENYQLFSSGGSIYPEAGIIRYAVDLGSVIQIIDDLEDCHFDYQRGVLSPENFDSGATRSRLDLSTQIVERTRIRLLELATQRNESQLHNALFTATERLAMEIAEFRAQRVLVRNR